jgi:hypothetical protein
LAAGISALGKAPLKLQNRCGQCKGCEANGKLKSPIKMGRQSNLLPPHSLKLTPYLGFKLERLKPQVYYLIDLGL